MRTILRAAGFVADDELTELVSAIVDEATWSERGAGGAAFVQLSKEPGAGMVHCVARVISSEVGELAVGAIAGDPLEAVRAMSDGLESAYVTRSNRLTELRWAASAPDLEDEQGDVSPRTEGAVPSSLTEPALGQLLESRMH